MVGKTLRERRETLGISLEEASSRTQIKQEFLKMLEEEDYALLPDPIYLSGFLRRYASFLDLDGEAILACFQQELSKPLDSRFQPAERESPWPMKRWRRPLLWALFLAAGVTLLLIWICWISQQGGRAVLPSLSPAPPASQPQVKRGPPGPSLSTRPDSVPKEGGHVLSLFARQRTWLAIQADEGRPREMMLQEGERITLSARQRFRMTLGNAGGVEMVLDGKPLPPPGLPGEVVRDLVLPPP